MSLPPYVVCCTLYSWNVHDKYNRNNLNGRSETCHQRTDCMRKRCRQILISLWKKITCKKIEWWAFHHTSCAAHYIAEMCTTSTTATISVDGPRPAIREPTAWENVVVKSLVSLWKKKTCKKIEWWAFHHTSCVAHDIAEMCTTSTTETISVDGPRPAIREPTAWENVVVKSLYPHTAASRCYFLAIIYPLLLWSQ